MNNELISREALKAEVALMFGDKTHITECICDLIDNTPTVSDRTEEVLSLQNTIAKLVEGIAENARPQGEWIKGREISRTMLGNKVEHIDYKDYTCSNCGLVLDNLLYWHDGSPFYKFCPNCGANMRKGGEENEQRFNQP